MLAEVVYRTTLSESSWMINRGNMKIGSGCKYNNLYPLMAINPEGIVNVAESPDSNLWHGRLGHMSQAGLDRLMAIGYIRSSRQRHTSMSIVITRNRPEVCTLSNTRRYISPWNWSTQTYVADARIVTRRLPVLHHVCR